MAHTQDAGARQDSADGFAMPVEARAVGATRSPPLRARPIVAAYAEQARRAGAIPDVAASSAAIQTPRQTLATELMAAHEIERQRLAADLHDGLGQSLSAVKFGLESVVDLLGKRAPVEARDTLECMVSAVRQALDEVRRIAMNLRPSTLDDLGVIATLSWFAREFHTLHRAISVETDFRVEEGEVAGTLKVAIFRVVQEAMNNVAKHSAATRARICIERHGRFLQLTIEDNGKGFDMAQVAARSGLERRYGHTCARERVEWTGGELSIRSSPGSGVIVIASWPLDPGA